MNTKHMALVISFLMSSNVSADAVMDVTAPTVSPLAITSKKPIYIGEWVVVSTVVSDTQTGVRAVDLLQRYNGGTDSPSRIPMRITDSERNRWGAKVRVQGPSLELGIEATDRADNISPPTDFILINATTKPFWKKKRWLAITAAMVAGVFVASRSDD